MSIDTKQIRAQPQWEANYGVNNTMTNGPEWVDPTTTLISSGQEGAGLPLVWGLKGSTGDWLSSILSPSNATDAWGADSDGYELWASLQWIQPEATGTMGACVQALDSDGASYEGTAGSGDPIVCHLVSTDGERVTDVRAVTWSTEEWAQGQVTKSPMNQGKQIAGATIDGTAVGYGEKIVKGDVKEEEVVEEEVTVVEDEEIVEEEEDADFQDDGWNDEAEDDEDGAGDEEGDADDMNNPAPQNSTEITPANATKEEEVVEEVVIPKSAIPNSINFHWYQPSFSATYRGLRRYGKGDLVQPYSIPITDGEVAFLPEPVGDPIKLAGATSIAVAAGIIVSAALAL